MTKSICFSSRWRG